MFGVEGLEESGKIIRKHAAMLLGVLKQMAKEPAFTCIVSQL